MSESIWRDETVIGLIQQRDNIQVRSIIMYQQTSLF